MGPGTGVLDMQLPEGFGNGAWFQRSIIAFAFQITCKPIPNHLAIHNAVDDDMSDMNAFGAIVAGKRLGEVSERAFSR